MKKFISVFTVLAMLFSLAACGGKGDDGGMLLISNNAEHNKILSGIHYKVAEAPPAE